MTLMPMKNTLAAIGLALGVVGFISSTWFLCLFSYVSNAWTVTEELTSWYWFYGSGVVVPISSGISLGGLISSIVVRHSEGKRQITTIGIVLGTLGVSQILFFYIVLLIVGTM